MNTISTLIPRQNCPNNPVHFILRLSGRTLAAHPFDQPDRIDLRHRTRRTKGCGSRAATLTMVFKLAHTAQRRWRKLNGSHQIEKVIRGVKFIDGIEESHHQKETITQTT